MAVAAGRRERSEKAPTRSRLSREQVVDAALDLVDREGLEALSLRKLAVSLGVTPMALYWHVADKEALLDALGERLFAGIVLPDQVDDWHTDLCAVLAAMAARLREHPAVAPLAMSTVLASEPGVVLAERVLSRLSDAGLDDRAAAGVGAYVLDALVALVGAVPGASLVEETEAQKEREQRKHEALAALPADRFPSVARMLPELIDCTDVNAYVQRGVDLLMLGVRGLAQS
jgi:TetR/AcrR family tetracycline transcriptional repressor